MDFTMTQSGVRNVTMTHVSYNLTKPPDYPLPDEFDHEYVMVVIGGITTAIAIIALIENIAALVLLGTKSNAVIRERRGFTISLALADALVGLSWTVFFMVLRLHATAQKIMHILSAFRMSMSTAGLWSLFSLVLDRYLVVHNPFNPGSIRKTYIPGICVLIWCVSIGVNFSKLARENEILHIVLLCIPRLPPCFGTIFLYMMIHWIAFKSRQRMTRNTGDNRFQPVGSGSWTAQLREAKRSVLLFSIVCLIYIFGLVTYVSLYIVQMKRCEYQCFMEDNYDIGTAQAVSEAMIIASSALNPWIHTFRHKSLGKRVQRMFCPRDNQKSLYTDRSSSDRGKTDMPLV